nr:hypothetical protein [Mucilaginibacter sp. X5P1]
MKVDFILLNIIHSGKLLINFKKFDMIFITCLIFN